MATRRDLEQALALEEEWSRRRSSDPLANYVPTPRQRPFIDAVLAGKYFDTWFIAANRAGKSSAGSYCGATLARFGADDARPDYGRGIEIRDRATSGWVVSVDYNTSRDTVEPKYYNNGYGPPGMEPFIPDREVAAWPTQANPVLKLKNGSLIGFKHGSQDRDAFQGADKNWIHFDEEPPRSIYEECLIRVGYEKLRVFGTCTILPPEGQVGGVSWIFSEIIQAWQQGKREGTGIFGASIYDNPHLAAGEVERLEAMYPEGSVMRRIRLGGEWLPGMAGARVYTGFHRGLHVVDLGEPNPRRPLAWVWDFNVEPMVSLVGQRSGRMFNLHDEIILDEGNIAEMVDEFVRRYPRHGAEILLYGDATGKHRSHQSNRSSYQLILNQMKTYRAPVRMKVAETNPPVSDRVNAMNRIFRDETGEVRFAVDPRCEELITDFENVLHDRQGGIKKTNDRRDPYYRRTHTSDACGYWVAYEEPVRSLDFGDGPSGIPTPPSPGYGIGGRS